MSTKRIHLFLASAICFSSTLFPNSKNQTQNHYNTYGATHEHQSNDDQRCGVGLFGDLLYWKPYFSNTPYYMGANRLNQNQPRPDGITALEYTPQVIDMNADLGFRIGGSYSNDWHKISFTSSWTRFHTSQRFIQMNDRLTNTDSSDIANPVAIDPFWGSNLTIPEGTNFKLSSNQTIKLDQFDFLFSTLFKMNDWLKVSPGGGIRGFLSTVAFKNTFTKNTNNTDRVFGPPFNASTENVRQRYYAVGALMSLANQFDLTHGFSCINSLQLGFLVGDCENKSILTRNGESALRDINAGSGRVNTLTQSNITVKPALDVDLGLQYEFLNAAKTFGFNLQVAYEAHILPDFLQFVYVRDTTSLVRVFNYRGDLIFQGMRARCGISF